MNVVGSFLVFMRQWLYGSASTVNNKKNDGSFLKALQPKKDFRRFMSGLLDSNQRPRAPQTCALPTAPNPELSSKDDAKVLKKIRTR